MIKGDSAGLTSGLNELYLALRGLYPTRVTANYNIGSKTTYRVGGDAAVAFFYENIEELEAVAELTAEFEVPIFVLGAGSNVLIADEGFKGLCLMAQDGSRKIDTFKVDQYIAEVTASGSVMLPAMARTLAASGIAGFQWAVGIPGTIGGSIKTNAGGHGSETSNSLVEVGVFDLSKRQALVKASGDLNLGYRTSNLTDTQVVLWAKHKLGYGEPEELKSEIDAIVKWRRENQPGGQNAGSIFVNPADKSAGMIIEELGLKQYRLGTAEVSYKHGNFIQADKNGRANDVFELICYLRETVMKATGIELKTELKLIGFS